MCRKGKDVGKLVYAIVTWGFTSTALHVTAKDAEVLNGAVGSGRRSAAGTRRLPSYAEPLAGQLDLDGYGVSGWSVTFAAGSTDATASPCRRARRGKASCSGSERRWELGCAPPTFAFRSQGATFSPAHTG